MTHERAIELAEKAAEQLRGTCLDIIHLGPEYEAARDEDAFCNRLDELVFCCEKCDWWHEMNEMSPRGEWICEECEP